MLVYLFGPFAPIALLVGIGLWLRHRMVRDTGGEVEWQKMKDRHRKAKKADLAQKAAAGLTPRQARKQRARELRAAARARYEASYYIVNDPRKSSDNE